MNSMAASLIVACVWTLDPAAAARPHAGAHEAGKLSSAALEALVAGVALYPDPLLHKILDAAQHPAELRQAAMTIARDEPVDPRWPLSVRELTQHSELLEQLDRFILLTARLGTAVQHQPDGVWQAIESVRAQVAVIAERSPLEGAVSKRDAALATVAERLYAPRVMVELAAVSIYGAAWSQPRGLADGGSQKQHRPEYGEVTPDRLREAHHSLTQNWDELSLHLARHNRTPARP
jgi:hypothetical protein